MSDILVIDDDLEIRIFLQQALKSEGHTVITASDGEEALGLASNFPVDLAFIDILMPNCDGFEVVKALNQTNPHTKKIAMSGSTELLPEMAKLGVDKTLEKPLGLEMVLTAVKELLES